MTSDVSSSPTYIPHIGSVHNGPTENLLSSTTKMLDSLISYYQQERMWVYRMRAQEACTPQLMEERPNQIEQAQSNSASDPSMGSSVQEHDLVDEPGSSNGQTRWMHRKREFKLRLEGIQSKRANPQSVQGQSVGELQPREEILEKFEKMMEARMESCQRVNKLVEEATRADAHQASITRFPSSTVAEVELSIVNVTSWAEVCL